MKKHLYMLYLLILTISVNTNAQNNLNVGFVDLTTVPDFLNICGDSDTEIVLVSVNGSDNAARQNIVATANLFEGVLFEGFDAANSSAGVTLISAADPTAPIFGLPDLQPGATSSVEIAFSISAKCEYLDTINANNSASVSDLWSFSYDLGGSTFTEDDVNTEYKDAFAVPSFTIDIVNNNGVARVGQCYNRDVVVTNSGLNGFVDNTIYENAQGAGVYVSALEVNGIPVTMTKVFDIASGDTIITATLDSTHFKLNTIGSGNPGDGDNFFDPNETVTITETICLVDCGLSRASIHSSSWGCEGRFCNSISISDFMTIGQGAANVIVTRGGTIPDQNTGYCQVGTISFTISNQGVEIDPGFATMTDIAAGVGLSVFMDLANGGYNITSFSIAGVDIPGFMSNNFLDGDPLFAVDPDGAGGLSDWDNDGFFDDLELNQSFEITAQYEFDCGQAQQLGDDETCPNEFLTSIGMQIDFTDLCQMRIPSGNQFLSLHAPSNSRSSEENVTDPDAFVVFDTFYISHTQSRAVNNFEKNCGGNEEYKAFIVLPAGVTPVITHTTLVKDAGVPFSMSSNFMSNDTFFMVFDASVTPFISGSYELVFALQADCTAEVGPTNFPTQLSFNCPEGGCDCEHIWWCGEMQGPQLHSTNPPCASALCPVGLQTTGFDVNRTSFGYTDTSYTVAYDQSLANKKVAIACDSVEMRIVNLVGDTPLTDSIGMVITYDNIDGTMSTDETFLFDYGTLRITNGGSEYICTVQPDVLTTVAIDSSKQLTFDLDSCLINFGITLQPGDTVEFVANFGLNPEGPYLVNFRDVPNLRGYGYGSVAGTDYACDNFGDNFTIAKVQSVFNIPNSLNYPEGCEETFLEYKILTTNNGFSDWFGNEYRQALKIDSITFDFDTAFTSAFTIFEPQVFIRNHPVHGNEFFDAPAFESFPDGHYVAAYDTLTGVPALNTAQGVTPVFNFRIRLIPNCRSQAASSNGDNRFQMDPSIYFNDRFYANDIGDGSCTDYIIESETRNVDYTNPPELTFTPVTNPNYTLGTDTAEWILQLCNVSFSSGAGLTWVALEDSNALVEIVSFEDISDPMNVSQLTFDTFGMVGNNYFAYLNGLTKADGMAPLDQICNIIRVRGVVDRCGTTDITARVGWNCIAYEEADWTPELYPPCEDLTMDLSLTTLTAFLDANVVEQPAVNPEICDTNTIAILVRNTDRGIAENIRTQIILPLTGASFVPGSFEVAYPSSQPFTSIAANPTFVGTNARGNIYEFSDFSPLSAFLDENGLAGFNTINPAIDSNEFQIRYKFVTDCDYVSGSLNYYNFTGFQKCGDPTNLETGETLPITINGAEIDPAKTFDIAFSDPGGLFPGQVNTLSIRVENRGTAPTDTSDKVKLKLPLGIDYQLNSSSSTLPASWTIEEPTSDTINGFQMIYWCLPPGVPQFETMEFSFDLDVPDYDCSTSSLETELFTISIRELACASQGILCDVELITSTNVGQLTDLPIFQNNLSFDLSSFNAVTSTCLNANQEQISVVGNLTYTGEPFPAVPFNVNYFFDFAGNGIFDVGDVQLATFTENGPFVNGDVITLSHTFAAGLSQVCSIVAAIDTAGLNLCGPSETPLGEIQLLNAGEDQLFCEDMPTVINTAVGDGNCAGVFGYTYNWTAIAPASVTDLSNSTIPNPNLMISHNGMTEDTLRYVLETIRPSCASVNYDTINVVRGVTVDIAPFTPLTINSGDAVTLTPSFTGSSSNFTYEWSPTGSLDDASIENPEATPMSTTTYYVTITSAAGCSDVDSVLVNVNAGLDAMIFVADTLICESEEFQLFASGGTNFLWEQDPANPPGASFSDPNSPNPFFIGGQNGSSYDLWVVVVDIAVPGVTDTAFITLTVDNIICDCESVTLNSVVITEASCGNFDGSATVNIVEDPADFDFIWSPDIGTPNADGNTRTDLIAGGYTVQVINPNDDSCVTEVFIAVSNEDGPDATVIMAPATCESADGKATMFPSNFTYFWPDGFIGDDRADLTAGNYIVTLTDPINPNCPGVIAVEIESENILDATVVFNTLPDCNASNGEVTINVTGGSGNYVYSWSSNSDTQTGLAAGTYMVTVYDVDAGCELIVPFVLANDVPGADVMITDTTHVTCNGLSDGAFVFSLNLDPAFAGPETVIITNGTDTVTNTNLQVGEYCVQVLDANGCIAGGACLEISEPDLLEVVYVTTRDCESLGTITTLVSGGTPPYTYAWQDAPGMPNLSSRVDLAQGNYPSIIQDANGCRVAETVPVEGCPCEEIATNGTVVVQATCGNSDGTGEILMDADPTLFGFTWTPDVGTPGATGNIRSDLPFGTYQVGIFDLTTPECITDAFVVITNANGPMATYTSTPATCEAADGTATLNPATYTYTWSDGGAGATRNDLFEGSYFVTLVDPADPDCPNVMEVIIGQDNPLIADVVVNTQPDCMTANGSVTVNVMGGSGSYTYSWPSNTNTQNGLAAGTYVITVTDTDATGCGLPVIFVLTDNVPPATVTITDTVDVSCPGAEDGRIDFTVNFDGAFTAPADTIITDGYTTYTNGSLPGGDYCMEIRDGNGCVAGGVCFKIEEPDPLNTDFLIDPDCGGAGMVAINVTGGTEPYTFDWADLDGTDNIEDRMGIGAGFYAVTVSDASSCTAEENVEVPVCPCTIPVLNSVQVVQATCGNADGSATIDLDSDESLYEYTWTPNLGIAGATPNVRTNLPAGGYVVEIEDADHGQCFTEILVVISNSDGPMATYESTPANCFAPSGSATFDPDSLNYLWPDSLIADTRNDLMAGSYFVTISEVGDTANCYNVIEVMVADTNALEVTSVVNSLPDCGVANGSVTLSVTGGSGTYAYSWPSGTDTETNLASGVHTVTITDQDSTMCSIEYTFALSDNVPPATVSITDTIDVTCFGAMDGGVVYEVLFDLAFNAPADTVITDGTNTFMNNNLPPGDYCILISDAAGCIAGNACFTVVEPEDLDLLFVITPTCSNTGSIDVTVNGGTEPYVYDWADLTGTDDVEDRINIANGIYELSVTDANACLTFDSNVLVPLCPNQDTCEYFAGVDTMLIQFSGCDVGNSGELCIDVMPSEFGNFNIYDNGILYDGLVQGCQIDTGYLYVYNELAGQGFTGPYNLNSWTVDGTTYIAAFNDLFGLVDSMNVWDPSGNWTLDQNIPSILGGNPMSTYSAQVIQNVTGTPQTIGGSFFTFANAVSINLDEGTHEIIVVDTVGGCADTMLTTVICTITDTISITIIEEQMDTICLNDMDLLGPIDTIFNICDLDNVTFEVMEDTTCVIFTGISMGLDTACLVACDTFGVCDTTIVFIEVIEIGEPDYRDSICVAESSSFVFDLNYLEVEGPVISMTNLCEANYGTFVEFMIDEANLELSYIGAGIGQDSACIEICDANICDTIVYTVNVLPCSPAEWVIDTIFINETQIFCIDTSFIPGDITIFENFCPDESGDMVDFFLNPETLCVEYTGLELGKDTACVVICNADNICDTTYFCILVVEYFDPPIANDDNDTTTIGTPVVIDIKANDILFGGIDTVYILEPPLYGTIGTPGNPNSINLDCSVTYNASDEFCEREDQFSYVVCTPTGCDTATVYIWLECIDIVIFTAVSPNGDGLNDVFYISGIKDYPDNELTIYNRWGNMVYDVKGYQNNWRGTWKSDKNLPDGTYFYILKLNDEDNRVFRGYIEMYR